MEQFVSQQNIERYRKLLDRSTDEAQRRMISKLLAEEQEKFRQVNGCSSGA
jgi:rubrerythrin